MRPITFTALCFSLTAAADPLTAHVTLYHFNIQYVAGGMQGYPDGKSHDPDFYLSEAQVEDLIVTQSFAPILDVLLRHESWHVDLEMQGRMVEVLAARHADTLANLRTLAKRGQVELVSLHYSDQLFVAYPKRDLVRSIVRNKKVFADNDLPLSTVDFNQEGQFNEGLLGVLAENGYTAAVMATNLWEYEHAEAPPSKFMSKSGVDVLVTGGTTLGDLTTQWSGPGDGELIVTGNTSPYLGVSGFHTVADDVTQWENDRMAEEMMGVQQLSLSELIVQAKQRGTFPPMPPITDGDWRPVQTHNLLRWMGGFGGLYDLFTPTEKDNAVLTSNTQASLDVAACEAVVAWAAAKPGAAARAAALDEAGKELALAEVSDSTGWTPWLGEVSYSLTHAQNARTAALTCIDAPELRGPAVRRIDLASGAVTDTDVPGDAGTGTTVDAPVSVTMTAPGRTLTSHWVKLDDERFELTVDVTAALMGNDAGSGDRTLSLTFPMTFDHIVYSTALDEGVLQDLTASQFMDGLEHTLPAPNGLVGLGPSQFLLKDTRQTHLAFLVRPKLQQVEVRDETIREDEPAHWRIVLVNADGPRALALAAAQNVTPVLEYPLTVVPKTGCGCASFDGAFGAFALILLLTRRSKRRSG